jgi:hypothetical protein
MTDRKQRGRRKRQKVQRKLSRHGEQKLVSAPQLQARKRILALLNDTIGSCDDLFAQHGEGCNCEVCCLVSNLVGGLRIFKMLLEIT